MKNRRILAKVIDMIAFGGFMSLGVRWFDSAWAGLALGGAYLLFSDALGMSAKNWFNLGVIDVDNGKRCSLSSSVLRNSPWLAAPLFRTALVSFHDGSAVTSYDMARGVVGVIGIIIAVTLWRGLGDDGSGRHWADVFAGTKVISLKPGESVRQPRNNQYGQKQKGGVRVAPDEDHDAVDFDDADESKPSRPRANPKPATPARDRDAVDFDDAN